MEVGRERATQYALPLGFRCYTVVGRGVCLAEPGVYVGAGVRRAGGAHHLVSVAAAAFSTASEYLSACVHRRRHGSSGSERKSEEVRRISSYTLAD